MEALLPLLYIIVLYGAFIAGEIWGRTENGSSISSTEPANFSHPPWATLSLFVAIGIPTTLQFFFPYILTLFRRDTVAFLAGDWWRVITPLFVQDGGVSGSIFNLVSLLIVGSIAERLWGSRRWLIIFFVSGVLCEIIALAWQPVGAGNSGANFALAGSVAVVCLTRNPLRLERIFAVVVLATGMLLLMLHDIHGAATALGAAIALTLIWFEHSKSQDGVRP